MLGPSPERLPFHTIGHSTLALEEFVALLRGAQVTRVVDVRTITRSRTNPQFNEATLPGFLATQSIGYEHLAALGGRRGLQRAEFPSLESHQPDPLLTCQLSSPRMISAPALRAFSLPLATVRGKGAMPQLVHG